MSLLKNKLNIDDIKAVIVNEAYYTFPNSTLTICLLTLKNGYTVTGQSYTVSKDNFDKQIGETLAKANAESKIWELEGYLLKEQLYNEKSKIN